MFRRGIRLPFTLLGVPLLLDWSFLVLLPLLAWIIGSRVGLFAEMFGLAESGWLTRGWTPYLLGLAAAVGLFVGVVLHELGHAVTARAYGVKVRSITLWFLGGVARFEDLPRHRGAEAVVAIVGPVVSLALAGACWLVLRVVPESALASRFVLAYLAYMNVVLGVFNLIPALPLDGGRVLRSLLALWLPFGRATQISGRISQGLAILGALLGLLSGNFFLLLIAFFVFMAVTAETASVRVEEMLRGVPVRYLMNPHVSTVPPEMRVAELSERMWRERHTAFPVVDDGGRVLGMVTIADAQDKDPGVSVGRVMHDVPAVPDAADAAEAYRVMAGNGFGAVLVTGGGGRLAGIVSKTDLMRALQFGRLGSDGLDTYVANEDQASGGGDLRQLQLSRQH